MPGDAMPFGTTMVHCTNQACQHARDTISHRLLLCTKQDVITPREKCMALLQAAINVPTAAEVACSPYCTQLWKYGPAPSSAGDA